MYIKVVGNEITARLAAQHKESKDSVSLVNAHIEQC